MQLTTKTVEAIFMDCLFKDGEDTSNHVVAEGILSKFGFHPGRLTNHHSEIGELLRQLPDDFHADKGGGMSFLNACMTRDGEHWGEHRNIEQLLALGIATKQAKTLMPRDMWSIFPGGMPYFAVLINVPPPINEPPTKNQQADGSATVAEPATDPDRTSNPPSQ